MLRQRHEGENIDTDGKRDFVNRGSVIRELVDKHLPPMRQRGE